MDEMLYRKISCQLQILPNSLKNPGKVFLVQDGSFIVMLSAKLMREKHIAMR